MPFDGDAAFVTLHASTAAMASTMCSGAARGRGAAAPTRRVFGARARERWSARAGEEEDEHVCACARIARAHDGACDDDASIL